MSTDQLDAAKALAVRLTEWGVDGASEKATAYVNDLVARGWVMDAKSKPVPRPPPAGSPEECRDHPGQWRVNCGPHRAERLAGREEEVEQQRLSRLDAIAAARAAIRRTPEETA